MERSFQGLSIAIETIRIIKELMEIWPNEVCDTTAIILLSLRLVSVITRVLLLSRDTGLYILLRFLKWAIFALVSE